MAEEKQVTIDNITALEPAMADEFPSSPDENTIEPLDLLEAPNVRTKLRTFAILIPLYVHCSILALGEH
jgi:hypothetical protein